MAMTNEEGRAPVCAAYFSVRCKLTVSDPLLPEATGHGNPSAQTYGGIGGGQDVAVQCLYTG